MPRGLAQAPIMHKFYSGADVLYTKSPKFLSAALHLGLSLGLAWLALKYLLPWLAPILAALALAAALEPAVLWLGRRARLPRGAASGVCVLLGLGLVLALLGVLLSRMASELGSLAERAPEMLAELSGTLELWRARLSLWLERGGTQARPYLEYASAAAEAHLKTLPAQLSGKLLGLLTSAAGAAPAVLLFVVTLVIGAYFASASWPELRRFLYAQLSPGARERAGAVCSGLRGTIVRWLRAQLLMMLIIFLTLLAAFALLRVNYALLLALGTAVIDALPVLGTGTVLIPWAVYELLRGEISLGLGLVIVYIAVTVLRNCIQAKLLGDQLGLHPLATLLAIYVGFASCGVLGMVIFPILLITAKQLNDSALVRLWKSVPEPEKGTEHDNRNNIEHSRRHGHERAGRNEYPSR